MSMRNYQKIRSLGKGSFGQAWLVLSKSDRSRYVAKVMQEFQTEEERADCFKEAQVLRSLKHPNIVRYVDSFAENEKFHIVMEFVDGGDLAQLIQRQKRTRKYLSESRVAHVFWQICRGVNHCHENRILHRDIKSGNIFLMKDGGVKVGDFGIARVLDSTTALARTKIGTPYYLSPEICQEKPYNQKSDVWALGCLLYEMLALEVPFKAKDIMNLMRMIMFRHPQPIRGGNYSSSMRNLVKSLLAKDPKRRPSVRQVMSHPLFQQFQKNEMTTKQQGKQRRRHHHHQQQQKDEHVKNSQITSAEATRYFEKLAELRVGGDGRRHRRRSSVQRPLQVRNQVQKQVRPVHHQIQENEVSRRRSLKQDDEEHLKQLAQARKRAYDERMALKKKMAGVGGRPQQQLAAKPKQQQQQSQQHHQQRRKSTVENDEEHLKQLAQARKQAYEERMALKKKMAGVGGRPQQQHCVSKSKQQQQSQQHHQQRRKSAVEKKEKELLRQLAEARKQAFEERMRLKEKMAGVGGRPSSNSDTQSRIHNTPPEEKRKNREMDREQRRKSLETERLRELREARVQAFEARMKLKKKMEGMDGRPVPVKDKKCIVAKDSNSSEILYKKKMEEKSNAYLVELAEARKRAFEERMALKKKYEAESNRTSSNSPPAIPMPVSQQQQQQQQQRDIQNKQQKRVEESEKLKLLAEARKRAFEERMALKKKMEGINGRSSSTAAAAVTTNKNVTEMTKKNMEERKKREEDTRLRILAEARKRAFEERMALKKKMVNTRSSSPQEILKEKVRIARTVVKQQKENIKQTFQTPTNRKKKKKIEEESPTFDFTTPPPPSCGPNRAERLHLKQYLEGHLGENLFKEICRVVISGKSAIPIMRKVPGGVQRAQHLIPMVRHFCRLNSK